MTEKSAFGHGYTFPCLFHVGEDGWALVSETGVGSNYCGSHLSDYNPQTGYTVTYPSPEEFHGLGSAVPAMSLPGETPWRTITIGADLKPIVETTVSYDVVKPLYEPKTDYKPGRYTWSWLVWQDNSINYDDQVKFIDTASEMGYEYCLVDNYWDTNIGRKRIEELSKYAQSKNVKLLLWYNSNGYANDAPQGPRNCMKTMRASALRVSRLISLQETSRRPCSNTRIFCLMPTATAFRSFSTAVRSLAVGNACTLTSWLPRQSSPLKTCSSPNTTPSRRASSSRFILSVEMPLHQWIGAAQS